MVMALPIALGRSLPGSVAVAARWQRWPTKPLFRGR